MITFTEVRPGQWQFSSLWPQGTMVKLTLRIRDVDGDIDEREVEWTSTQDLTPFRALREVAEKVDELPFWRASSLGSYLTVEPTNPDNDFAVTLEVQQV